MLKDIYRPNRYALDDRFVLRDGQTHPFAVICPGGGYSIVCSFIEGTPIARRLNERGISAFIVYYRVRGKARFPQPQDDLARAVEEILSRAEEYRVEKESYSVWGSSAGGHLAASFGTESMGWAKYGLPKPGAIVLSYPVISMVGELPHRETHDNLLGRHATLAQEKSRKRRRAGELRLSACLYLVRRRGQHGFSGEYAPYGCCSGERGRTCPLRDLPGCRARRGTRHGDGC